MSSMLSIKKLVYGGKAGHDLIRLFPYIFQAALDILDVRLVDPAILVCSLGILVEVIAAPA